MLPPFEEQYPVVDTIKCASEIRSSLLISILLHLRQCLYIQQYNLATGKVKTKKEQDQLNEEAAKAVVSELEHQDETVATVRLRKVKNSSGVDVHSYHGE